MVCRKPPARVVSQPCSFGHEPNVFALMLALPATLIGLVALLAITSGLERQLARTMRPAHVRSDHGRVPVSITARR